MSWPAKFDDPSREALILVPSPDALVQDLGPFRTGHHMETDILPRSALVCLARDRQPIVDEDGLVRFAFEGNANGAANLSHFYEKCKCAAGRLAQRAASIAYGEAPAETLTPVARFNLLSYTFTEILDLDKMEAWSGESASSYLPPADLKTPTSDPQVTNPLCALPMRMIAQGEQGIYAWLLMDGTILTKRLPDDGPLTAWRAGDEGLVKVLEKAGVEPSRRISLIA